MTLFSRHLDDVTVWAAALDAGALTPRAAAHVRSCARCDERWHAARSAMADCQRDLRQTADQAVPPEVLARQRQTILRRLNHTGGPGRVLTFPGRSVPRAGLRLTPGWLTAAAAVGLAVGLLSGRWMSNYVPTVGGPATAAVLSGAVAGDASSDTVPLEDALLAEVEEAVEGHPRPEFDALDGLTPVNYEIR